MAKIRQGMDVTTVSTNSAIQTKASIYYGCTVVNKTTAGVQALVYDAKATAQGQLIDVVIVTAGTYNNQGSYFANGLICHSGIYLSALVCTTASDSIIVFYGGV